MLLSKPSTGIISTNFKKGGGGGVIATFLVKTTLAMILQRNFHQSDKLSKRIIQNQNKSFVAAHSNEALNVIINQ